MEQRRSTTPDRTDGLVPSRLQHNRRTTSVLPPAPASASELHEPTRPAANLHGATNPDGGGASLRRNTTPRRIHAIACSPQPRNVQKQPIKNGPRPGAQQPCQHRQAGAPRTPHPPPSTSHVPVGDRKRLVGQGFQRRRLCRLNCQRPQAMETPPPTGAIRTGSRDQL